MLINLNNPVTNWLFSWVIGYWLFVIGYWLWVIDSWLLIIGYGSLIIGYWLLVIGHWLLVIGYGSLVIGYWDHKTCLVSISKRPCLHPLPLPVFASCFVSCFVSGFQNNRPWTPPLPPPYDWSQNKTKKTVTNWKRIIFKVSLAAEPYNNRKRSVVKVFPHAGPTETANRTKL